MKQQSPLDDTRVPVAKSGPEGNGRNMKVTGGTGKEKERAKTWKWRVFVSGLMGRGAA